MQIVIFLLRQYVLKTHPINWCERILNHWCFNLLASPQSKLTPDQSPETRIKLWLLFIEFSEQMISWCLPKSIINYIYVKTTRIKTKVFSESEMQQWLSYFCSNLLEHITKEFVIVSTFSLFWWFFHLTEAKNMYDVGWGCLIKLTECD